jgi:hypothetical protein
MTDSRCGGLRALVAASYETGIMPGSWESFSSGIIFPQSHGRRSRVKTEMSLSHLLGIVEYNGRRSRMAQLVLRHRPPRPTGAPSEV